MNLHELILKNRSCREFIACDKISHDNLLSWIDNARITASTVNLQPLKYHIAEDENECSFIREHVHFAGMLTDYSGPSPDHNPSAYILIFTDTKIAANPLSFDKDVGIAAQTILLSAVEKGYGGCMIGAFDNDKIRGYLSVDDSLQLRLLIALGRPDNDLIKIELEDAEDGNVSYYRIGNVHHVPKRPLSEILIERK